VVLGHDAKLYLHLLPTEPVINPKPDKGQFSSIQVGLKSLSNSGAFLLPMDVPVPGKEVWFALETAMTEEVQACQPTFEGKGGHPVLVSEAYSRHLQSLGPSMRLDYLIRGLPPEAFRAVPVSDPGVIRNLNTPEAFDEYVKSGA